MHVGGAEQRPPHSPSAAFMHEEDTLEDTLLKSAPADDGSVLFAFVYFFGGVFCDPVCVVWCFWLWCGLRVHVCVSVSTLHGVTLTCSVCCGRLSAGMPAPAQHTKSASQDPQKPCFSWQKVAGVILFVGIVGVVVAVVAIVTLKDKAGDDPNNGNDSPFRNEPPGEFQNNCRCVCVYT